MIWIPLVIRHFSFQSSVFQKMTLPERSAEISVRPVGRKDRANDAFFALRTVTS